MQIPPESYYLDIDDENVCLIKQGEKRYHAGTDKIAALELVERLNAAYHPNVEEINNTLYVCWNHHDAGVACNFMPEIENCWPLSMTCSLGYRMDV